MHNLCKFRERRQFILITFEISKIMIKSITLSVLKSINFNTDRLDICCTNVS